MNSTSFPFRHILLLCANFSQSHATSCLSRMSHHWVNSKCNRAKGQHWRWLIYAHVTYYVIICYMFSEATTTVLEGFRNSTEKHLCWSLFFAIDLLLFYREHFYGFLESDLWKCQKKKSFHNKHLLKLQTDILKFFEALFCTYCKGLFCV